jgi:hypothetical protein
MIELFRYQIKLLVTKPDLRQFAHLPQIASWPQFLLRDLTWIWSTLRPDAGYRAKITET